MREPQCSRDPHAAKRGVGIHLQVGWRYTDKAVKEPAVQRQLRIRRRHLGRDSTASITKYLSAQNPCAHAPARRPGPGAGRSGSTAKSSLGSGSCSCFCPAAAVDTTEPHDKLKKRKRCTNSMSSALLPLFTKRGGTRAEFIAEFPQNTCVGASTDGAAG
jgi:hypothetical protein